MAVLAAGLLVVAVLELVRGKWTGPNGLLVLLLVAVAVGIHESGHALGALLVRSVPVTVEIGRGPVLLRIRLPGLLWIQRSWPWRGSTRAVPAGERPLRIRSRLVELAGPLANLAVAAAAVPWMEGPLSLDPGLAGGFRPLRMWVFAHLLMALGALVPYSTGGEPSDGWRLLRLPWLGRAPAGEIRGLQVYAAAVHHVAARRWEDLERAVSPVPGDVPEASRPLFGLYAALARSRLGRREEARAAADAVVAADPAPLIRWAAEEILGVLDLLDGRLERADARTAEVLRHLPWDPSVLGARGVVLALRDRPDEAASLLREAAGAADDRDDRAWAAAGLAIAAARSGDAVAAARYRKRAAKLDPTCPLLPLAEAADRA